MRLDKYICQCTELTRSDAKKRLKYAKVRVNGEIIKNAAFKVTENDNVAIDGETLSMIGNRYIMLHKPEDMICSTIDEVYPSVLNLIDIEKHNELHIAGRLDADTTGLVFITDDGKWSHQITSPKKLCQKTYRIILQADITDSMVSELEQGVALHGESELTKPAIVNVLDPRQVLLTIHEGKYHQVKRMCAAVGNKVIELHRQQIGEVKLDDLAEGQWRFLTEEEIASFH
jgi:16S rRNA pseudouridine516 synthase